MRLASISFHWKRDEVGGAQLPAAAMTSWARRLGFSADNIAFTKSGRPSSHFVGPEEGLKTYRLTEFFDVANSYDCAFFATPGEIKGPKNYEQYFKHLAIPFVTMLHGEYDLKLYAQGGVDQIVHHPMCRALLVVGDDAMPVWESHLQPPSMLTFYPCGLPDHLLRQDTEWTAEERHGLIYAARLTTVKHAPLLAKLTLNDDFMAACDETVDAHGVAPIHHIEKNCTALNPRWHRFPGFYNVYDVAAVQQLFSRYAFYWEVFGSTTHKWVFPRYNLSAIEAISSGCVPVVNPRYAPDPYRTLSFSARLDPLDFSIDGINAQLRDIREIFPQVQARMREVILDSSMSYEGVERQVKRILDVLTDSRRSAQAFAVSNPAPIHADAAEVDESNDSPLPLAMTSNDADYDRDPEDDYFCEPHTNCPAHYGRMPSPISHTCSECDAAWDCERMTEAWRHKRSRAGGE